MDFTTEIETTCDTLKDGTATVTTASSQEAFGCTHSRRRPPLSLLRDAHPSGVAEATARESVDKSAVATKPTKVTSKVRPAQVGSVIGAAAAGSAGGARRNSEGSNCSASA